MRKVQSTRRTWTRGVAVAALALGMATGVPSQAGAHNSVAAAGQFSVAQKNLQFNPFELTVALGDTVTWTNHETDGNTIHSVVQKGGSEINSPDIPAETSFTWTFTTAQQYDIVCRFHPDMFMTVHVLDAEASKAAAKAAAKGTKDAKGKGAKAKDLKATDKTAKDKSATDKSATKTKKAKKVKKADPHADMDHDAHEESVKKSVPAPPPGPPDSTVPGIGGLPISWESSRQR